ncbi:multicopper oxidase domain-containing protein [Pseudonocardia sp. C8]|uniref:multicopper oxidase family protein n=1 Tax=Pseudonocardia sp. C8 TaxID=2762759 RepID=UPI001642FBC0|nr:multicopper oxidase domain-containing protein [Pseudonocardia sp. C8]MBC3190477.1 multicopper oxidase domain-containing protein [Pseudonocardia sp. C8]
MTRAFTRRRFLGTALAGAGAAGGLLLAGCGGVPASAPRPAPVPRPLTIPPLAPSTREGGVRTFTLTAAPGRSAFLAGADTPTWGYDQPFGGPTLRAARGERVRVHVTNRLPETTTTHWHGMVLPAAMDGGPHQPIRPGATWSPEWTIEQPAATLWYHPHPHGHTERHVHRGLAGLFLVDDEDGPATALPHRYGVDDIPVVVTDRVFTATGAFDETRRNAHGLVGDTLLVNGTVAPYLTATTARIRLRLLNASPARCYRFARSDGRPLVLAGTDSGLLAAPRPVPDVLLTPGERAEVLLDLDPGRPVVLRSLPQDLGAVSGTERSIGALDTLDVLQIRPAAVLAPAPPLPGALPHEPGPDPAAATTVRRFALGNDTINGKAMDMTRIDEVVPAGATELWELTNVHSRPHNLHVHDARGQVVAAGGHPVPPELRSWKDTVYVPPRTTTRVLLRFGRHADPGTPYMYHCHLLYHEDQGMMGQFVVAPPGVADVPRVLAGGHHG